MFSHKNEVLHTFSTAWLTGNTASLALELCKCTVFELGWVLAVSANSSQNSK